MRFVWDAENILHIARHGVTPQEAEQVLTDDRTIHVPTHSGRLSAYGLTPTGRAMRVVYDQLSGGMRVTTAYQIRRRLLTRIQEDAQQ
ncbi:MAG: BrnT family toxin [Chloroflexota bacterium]|nr:BrnT family toxin [Chloroflexota bacterium]